MTELTFALEPYTQELFDELKPLAEEHARELVPAEYNVRFPHEGCFQLEERNRIRCYIARSEGKIVGYNGFALLGGGENGSLVAEQLVLFLKQDFRKFFNALKFLKWCDDQLVKDGVQFVNQHVTEAVDYSPLLRRLNYVKAETVYRRRLWVTQ